MPLADAFTPNERAIGRTDNIAGLDPAFTLDAREYLCCRATSWMIAL